MHIKNTIRQLPYLLVAVQLAACIPTDAIIATPVPTSAVPPVFLAETLVASPAYLIECKAINSSSQPNQAGYLGIFPGKSTIENVEILLGNPDERNRFERDEEWVYTDFSIYVEDGTVASIDVHGDAQILVSLKQLIFQYGCPDLIFAVDESVDQPSGSYGLTKFIYLTSGMEAFIPAFPVSLSDAPAFIVFFPPESLRAHLERYDYTNMNYSVKNGKPVSWSEAVR